MEKPKFRVPKYIEGRAGRVALFLGSVAAVCYLLVKFSGDYITIYQNSRIALPVIAKAAITATQFMASYWWVIAIGAILLTTLFYAVTKSGTIFTVLSILVWLAGVAAYVALYLPSRGLEKAGGG